MNDHENCLMVFVKDPEKGRVKSRLAKAVGEDTARDLYRCFVLDLIEGMLKGDYRTAVCFHPPDSERAVSDWLGPDYLYAPQAGGNLGERMGNAFRKAYADGFLKAVLIGSDFPDLPQNIIEEAFRKLDTHESVIGPAADGGYYLIGFSREGFSPAIFNGIEWGTESVFEETTKLLETAGRTVHLLPEWRDIDRVGDLDSLFERHVNTHFAGSRTMSYLRLLRELK